MTDQLTTGPVRQASWREMPLAAFDLETTGRDPLSARIVTACVIRIDGIDKTNRTWLLDPGVEIPAEAAAVHGVSTETARADGMDYQQGYHQIREDLHHVWDQGAIAAIFNANYDLTVIDTEGRRLGYPPLLVGPVVDPFVIDREVDRYRRGRRNLAAICEHYGIELGEDAHTADGDALATARVAWKLPRLFPLIADLTAEQLMAAQADWHRARQVDYAAYLRRSGEDDSQVCGDWPLRAEAVTR
ncbi:3'-5' exonuclease [Nocardia sp. NBC_01388]|uniref:3'-5' exonuclease n=1 Tax=Nocardia sp. NBC_01388 TaxID=2903596 RepID=UPI00324D6F8A